MALKSDVFWLCQPTTPSPVNETLIVICGEASSVTGLIFDLSHRTTNSKDNLYRSRRQDNAFQTNVNNCHKLHHELHLPCSASGTQLHSRNVLNNQIKTEHLYQFNVIGTNCFS